MKKKHGTKKIRLPLEKQQRLSGYIFCLPLIIGILCLFIPNVVRTVWFSLNDISVTADGYTLDWAGIEFYKEALLKDVNFNTYSISALKDMLIELPVILVFSLFIASILNQKFKGRSFVRSVFFLPIILSTGIVSTIMADTTVSGLMTTGITNDIMATNELSAFSMLLKSLNLGEGLMDIIISAANSVTNIINSSGMQILIFITAFQEIPDSLYEAASVEGCSKWELFWKITIPMVSPQIAINAIYTVADSFVDNKVFTYSHDLAFSGNQYSLATSMNVLYLLALGLVMGIIAWLMVKLVKASR
ncbi:MAG: sugar ABC transporter permease [Clostridia bacterium]|nr:sugar ABC transporter permease [Clostridia bacterium]